MLGTLGLLGGLFTVWWLLLWWGLPVNLQKISPSALLLLHIAPPVLVGWAYRMWAALREKHAAQAVIDTQLAAQTERDAIRDAARDQHQQQLAERQLALACRGIWAQALAVNAEPEWISQLPDGVFWQVLTEDEIDTDQGLPDALAESIEQVLSDLYATAPGAAWLPHYFEAQPEREGREQLAMLQSAQAEAFAAQLFEEPASGEARFLPGSGALMARVQQLLQQDPAQPGMVVLAADAPLLTRGIFDEWDEPSEHDLQKNQWEGMPSYAAIAMVFLRDTLPSPDEFVPASRDDAPDVYTPYWEKQQQYGNEFWGRVPAQWQSSLVALPVIAAMHQAEQAEVAQRQIPRQIQSLARQVHGLCGNALINAGLRDYPFSEEDQDEAKDQASQIAWLIHNSGDVDVGATRLAAVSSVLTQFDVPLNPIDDASNCVREWGDVGAARTILHAAVAMTHSARLAAPTILTEFEVQGETELVRMMILQPPMVAA